MNIALFVERSARLFGDRPALSVGTRTHCTYSELARRVATIAGGLTTRLSLRREDRVGIAMANAPEYLEVMCACWHAGLTAVPINAKLHRREFAHILEDSGARVCFVGADLQGVIEPLVDEVDTLEHVVATDSEDYRALHTAKAAPLCDVDPDAPAWLFFTSGTTGRPKGAMLSHRNLLAMTLCYFSDVDSIDPTDCIVHAAPLSHGSGLYAVPHLAKGANNVVPATRGFDPAEIAGLISSYRGVTMFLAPTMIVRLLADSAVESADLRGLKTIAYGGGPMYVEDLQRALDRFGPKLVQIYGQGETPMTITCLSKAAHADQEHPRYLERLASVGTPMTVVEVRVVDADDRTLPPDESGEVIVRGETVISGYWRNPKASAETLRGGWLHTGDIAVMDRDGYLTLKDRLKDVIISGGANIYPREVEEVLVQHEAVLEAAVVGRPDPQWGEQVIAFVVVRPGHRVSEEELDRVCLDHIARFKRPREYRFVSTLPKNNNGKVVKMELRSGL